jgi:hypothetical protein
MQYDCGQSMCNLCTSSNPTFPCVGVPGAANSLQTGQASPPPPTDPTWKYGNKTLVPLLRQMDTDSTKQCSSHSGLGLYDIAGTCISGSLGVNSDNATQKNALLVNYSTFQNFTDPSSFPLQGVHKVWGDAGGKFNKGVNSKNVYVSPGSENVVFSVGGVQYNSEQPVLVLEAHGDKYSGTVPGLTKKGTQNASCFIPSSKTFYQGNGRTCNTGDTVMPQCPNWAELDSSFPGYNKRVGGVACTRGQYGPGVYNLLCYIPQTEDTSNGGRGYVFAMWPFHYEEIYKGQQKIDDSKIPCYNECDGMVPVEAACPPSKGCYPSGYSGTPITDDYFSVINHEIDIEIPCNSPQLDWKTQMTWDTMNCNTWLSDINYYGVDTGAYYSQVAVKNPNGLFISTEAESSSQKDYHWYTLDWYVDPVDSSKNYVAFYFDDPFDPSGNVTVTNTPDKLPLQPSGKPVFITQRFVPTRSGRLNFGPWMAWWGYGANDGFTPNFDTVKVRMAQLSISPYSNLWDASGAYLLNDFPQSYDQPGAICDFKDLVAPSPSPSSNVSSKGFPLWAIVVIILGTIVLGLVIYAIVDSVKRKKLGKLGSRSVL